MKKGFGRWTRHFGGLGFGVGAENGSGIQFRAAHVGIGTSRTESWEVLPTFNSVRYGI